MMEPLSDLLKRIEACRICQAELPLGPRPVVIARSEARLLIVGQAPGIRVHRSGLPWNDPSGDRLRAWMQVDRATFYQDARLAMVPMGFCYPGTGKSGDLPPRPECAPQWHGPLLQRMPQVELTLVIGQYAQQHYLKDTYRKTLTETVRCWEAFLPECFPLPHPSPRNNRWLRRNGWFEENALPGLRSAIQRVLGKKERGESEVG